MVKYINWVNVFTDLKQDDSVFKVIYEIQVQSHDGYCSGVDDDDCKLSDKTICDGYLPKGEYTFESDVDYRIDPTTCSGSHYCDRLGNHIKLIAIFRLDYKKYHTIIEHFSLE